MTAREAEVLSLLAQHLTNVQIAETLFISVRTVESHVSALLRKFQLPDRRSLARRAEAELTRSGHSRASTLPAETTPLVGRAAERAKLADTLAAHRMVTATGPGGVGKTRLALSVAADIATGRRDGAWFVDLVGVTDPAMVMPAVASAIGVTEQRGSSVESTLLATLAQSDGVLLLDNCEHLIDGVRSVIERILAASTALTVLATSRSRLTAPWEWVYEVPGLSVTDDGGDAVELFAARVAAADHPTPPDPRRIAGLCRALDGMALAIELAAARYPTLGMDGLETALDERLRFLTFGMRVADRHRSLRDAITWSYDLLGPDDQALLQQVSAFASWFDVEAATAIVGGHRSDVTDGLARLANDSLLVVRVGEPTRYRALESIRQYGIERLDAAGEHDAVRLRHDSWCRHKAAELAVADPDDEWCSHLDHVLEDLRIALQWSSSRADRRADAADLARRLAGLLFLRGFSTEAQRRFEQAAELATTNADRVADLRQAAGAAFGRYAGNDTLRLHRAAADLSAASGDGAAAAYDLAWMTIHIIRAPGIMSEKLSDDDARRFRDEAVSHSDGSARAEAAIATATACCSRGEASEWELSRRAVELARDAGDGCLESAAIDQLCAVELTRDDLPETVRLIRRRGEVIDGLPVEAASAMEHLDFRLMGSEVLLAAGDLEGAGRHADILAALPFVRGDDHVAVARRVKVDSLAGRFDDAVESGERFLGAWSRSGRPRMSDLSGAAYALAMVHGILGDDENRERWRQTTIDLGLSGEYVAGCSSGWAPTFDAILALHRNEPDVAVERLAADLDDRDVWGAWHSRLWRPWYAAVWSEAAVLAGLPDADHRLTRGRDGTRDNPIARTIVERAVAIRSGDGAALDRCATEFERLGCPYQYERTRELAAGG